MAIESLIQNSSVFADSMRIKDSAAEKTADENVREAKTPNTGDIVTISEEGRAIAAVEDSSKSEDAQLKLSADEPEESDESEADRIIRMLKEQIEKLEEQLKEVEASNMPQKMKQSMVQEIQAQLMELNKQLADALESKFKSMGHAIGGGTRAKTFGNSVDTF